MSDADTPAEATETQDAPQEEQSPDALTSRMDEIQSGFSSLQGDVRQLLEQRQEPEEEEEDEYGDFLTDDEGHFYDPRTGREVDPQELAWQQRERELEARFEQKLAPVQEWQAEQQARDLQARYPELQKAEVAQEVFQEAQQAAAAYGNPALAQNAGFLEQTYLARLARQQAETQGPSEAADAALEGAGAQVPAEGDNDDMMDRVAEAHASKGASFWDS